MKKSIRIILVILVLASIIMQMFVTASSYIPTEDLTIDQFTSIETLKDKNMLLSIKIDNTLSLIDKARELGYSDNDEVIKSEREQLLSFVKQRNDNAVQLNNWDTKFQEYPYATYVWLYLTDVCGYNKYVAAGILGNMMVEVGGSTLDLQYWLYSYGNSYYYGICQWGKKTYPGVRGTDLITQCDFLKQTIKEEFDTFGYAYSKGFNYDKFLNLQNVEAAAKAFAVCYERCGSSTYDLRQSCALTAYRYFEGS